jgi:multiple sugar transport system permease protein
LKNTVAFKVGAYALHIFLAVLILFPLMFALISSLRPLEEMYSYISPISWKTFIPTHVTGEAYVDIFTKGGLGRAFLNSFIVVGAVVVFGILFNSMAAFAFAKFAFRGKNVLFVLVLLTFMVPFELISIPLYNLVQQLGWIDTYYSLIIPAVANGLVIFLFRQFFVGIPDAIINSALIDGASWFRIFAGIMMPLSMPVSISAGLLLFITQWESFLWPVLVTSSSKFHTVQVAISDFNTEHATIWNQLFAASILTVVIPILILLPLQRYFVQGIAATGSKES